MNFSDPTPVPTLSPEMLRPAPNLEVASSELRGALKDHILAILEDPAIRGKVVELIAKAIPGKPFDFLAAKLYDVAIQALKTVLDDVLK